MTRIVRKTLLVLAITLAPVLAAPSAKADCFTPASNEVAAFQHGAYGGTCYLLVNLTSGGLNSNDNRGPGYYFADNQISAIKVGNGQNVASYQHWFFGGTRWDWYGGSSYTWVGAAANDQISSMKSW